MPPLPDPNSIFLNAPYNEEFMSLYVAYIVGLRQLNLVPHLASEIPGGDRRLNNICKLIQCCRYSVHDLSREEASSDLNGTDPNIHHGTAVGVLRELCNVFRRSVAPTVPGMVAVYRFVHGNLDAILHRHGSTNPYDRSEFVELCWLSKTLADLTHNTKPVVQSL